MHSENVYKPGSSNPIYCNITLWNPSPTPVYDTHHCVTHVLCKTIVPFATPALTSETLRPNLYLSLRHALGPQPVFNKTNYDAAPFNASCGECFNSVSGLPPMIPLPTEQQVRKLDKFGDILTKWMFSLC